ncbi:helix-turn-helix domain-containing protein [Dyadobacter sp. 3J3]|uniref:winged helix-turn-helix transcriptional regulator n=1 Tax=Dyadobacter sp. 3J3 TaxID=2606600 RepID=UPI00135A1D12|nr:helix-turn-helix domain-containing protein [Dyadobacter sp. 3J3]
MERYPVEEMQALQDTLYVIGGKWKLPILYAIRNGNKRFRAIERSIPGISTRMLSRELKDLEMNKLIIRSVYPDTPVLVEYNHTDYCQTFCPVIMSMIDWGIAHKKAVKRQ